MVGTLRNAPRRAAVAAALFVGLACAAGSSRAGASGQELWAFAAPWDPRSDSSLARHGAALDVAVSGWIELDSADATPRLLYADTVVLPRATRRFAIVTSWHRDRFHPRTIAALGSDGARLASVASRVAAIVARAGYRGIVIDLEGHRPSELDALRTVVAALADSVRAHGGGVVAMAVPATDTSAYPAAAFAPHVDYLMPMLYDLHWSGSTPGPIVTAGWARDALALRVREVGASRVVAALPLYGYYWRATAAGQTVGHGDAQRIAAAARTTLVRDASSGQLVARVADGELWITDAAQVRALREMARTLGVGRIALWRLGLEDRATWAK